MMTRSDKSDSVLLDFKLESIHTQLGRIQKSPSQGK